MSVWFGLAGLAGKMVELWKFYLGFDPFDLH